MRRNTHIWAQRSRYMGTRDSWEAPISMEGMRQACLRWRYLTTVNKPIRNIERKKKKAKAIS